MLRQLLLAFVLTAFAGVAIASDQRADEPTSRYIVQADSFEAAKSAGIIE